jgi:hypothetical protein
MMDKLIKMELQKKLAAITGDFDSNPDPDGEPLGYPPLDDNLIDRLVRELTREEMVTYRDALMHITWEDNKDETEFDRMQATVEQKARAYIATMEEK